MSSVSTNRPSGATFLRLPPEIRLKIYNFLFQLIISELPDNLFAIFTVFDNTYDTTRDLQIQCEPYERHMRCPHKPISTSLCGHHRAGWLASLGPPILPPKIWTYYKFDFAAVFMDLKPAFKAWVEKDKELWGRIYAGEDPFRSGLTSILHVNRNIYHEAIEVLYEHAEIVVHLHDGMDYLEKQNSRDSGMSSYPRFEGVQLTPLSFAKRLKLNIWLHGQEFDNHFDKLIQRLERLMDVLENGSNLDFLEIFIDGISSDGSEHFCRVMEILKARLLSSCQPRRRQILVSLGAVSVEQYSSEAFDAFLDAVNGWVIFNFYESVLPMVPAMTLLVYLC